MSEIPLSQVPAILTTTVGVVKPILDFVSRFGDNYDQKQREEFFAVHSPLNYPKAFLKKQLEELNERLKKMPEECLKSEFSDESFDFWFNSTFYLDEDIIRNNFNKLIEASLDKRFDGKVHRSFGNVVKNLGPQEASLFDNIQTFDLILFSDEIKTYNHKELAPVQSNGFLGFKTDKFHTYQNDEALCFVETSNIKNRKWFPIEKLDILFSLTILESLKLIEEVSLDKFNLSHNLVGQISKQSEYDMRTLAREKKGLSKNFIAEKVKEYYGFEAEFKKDFTFDYNYVYKYYRLTGYGKRLNEILSRD